MTIDELRTLPAVMFIQKRLKEQSQYILEITYSTRTYRRKLELIASARDVKNRLYMELASEYDKHIDL